MPKIRIHLRFSPSEWEKIDLIIKNKLEGKDISAKKRGLAWFITNGVHQEFSKSNKKPCQEIKVKKVRKGSDITVSNDIFEALTCQSSEASISPSELVKRRLFDVHLLPPKPTE